MNPAVERAARSALEDWRREASGSRESAETYLGRVKALEERAAADIAAARRLAEEHRKDAERAEAAVADLENALRAEGLQP